MTHTDNNGTVYTYRKPTQSQAGQGSVTLPANIIAGGLWSASDKPTYLKGA